MRRILTAASLYSVTATALRTALLTSTPPIAAATALNRAGFASMTVAIDKPTVVERLDEIASPPLDERHYRWVKLSNGLEALLVHDKDAVLAAGALEVKDAGHFSDPASLPGLAHFVEHMCFLGTEREPEEGAFKAYLQRHGGSSNAFTGMEATGFHFSVGHGALPGALERFAAFFTCPLMREESCDREINAIDSEFRRNLQSDVRRLFQLTKSTSSHDHPFHKFSTGNLQTLGAASHPHEAVMAFYREHYLAGKMHLSVFGRESLDELEEQVVRCFADLRTERVAPPPSVYAAPANVEKTAAPTEDLAEPANGHANGQSNGHSNTAVPAISGPFSSQQRGAMLRATPVRETRMLRLMWELPPEKTYRESKLLRLLTSLGSQEGEGSLAWLLTQRLDPPLATSVSASSLYSLSDATVWGISVTLTPDGLANHEEVARHAYSFLQSLNNTVYSDGLPEYLLNERRTMSTLGFDFAEQAEPLPLVKAIASRMYLHEPAKLLAAPYEWPDAFDHDGLRTILESLTPERALLLLVDPAEIDEAERQTEPWYGTPHQLAPLPKETLAEWAKAPPHPELLVVPPSNPYVPDDVSMLKQPDIGAAPTKSDDPDAQRPPRLLTTAEEEAELGGRIWHLDSGKFDRPRASIITLLRTPVVTSGGPVSSVLSQIGAELLCDQLTTPLAPCGLAGLGWSVSAHSGGLMIQAAGYSQRLPKLSTDLAKALASFEPDPARFAVVREVLERALRNRRQERPLWHAQNAVTRTIGVPSHHYEEALAYVASDDCTPNAVASHMKELISANFIELLVHGNLLPDDAMRLGEEWRAILNAKPLPADCAPLPGFSLLPTVGEAEDGATKDAPETSLRLSGVAANKDEANSAIEVFHQIGELNLREEALLLTLSQIASKSAFHRLRTELQLGYVVQCGIRSVNRCRGLTVLIQSAVADPPKLEEEIEDWLVRFREGPLAELDSERYAEYQDAVARNLDEPPKTLHQEASALWPEILEGTHRWNHPRELAAEVRTLKVEELLEMFDERIAKGGKLRRKLASHWYSQAEDEKAKAAE